MHIEQDSSQYIEITLLTSYPINLITIRERLKAKVKVMARMGLYYMGNTWWLRILSYELFLEAQSHLTK